jgi:hypothetical protein
MVPVVNASNQALMKFRKDMSCHDLSTREFKYGLLISRKFWLLLFLDTALIVVALIERWNSLSRSQRNRSAHPMKVGLAVFPAEADKIF